MNRAAQQGDIPDIGNDPVAKAARVLWPMTLAIIVVQMASYYSILPEQVATHFDLQGNPDDWTSKGYFYAVWVMLLLVTNIWVPLTKVLFRKLPPSLLSLPNKEYWLATEGRRKIALAVTHTFLRVVFALTNLLFVSMFHHTVRTSLGEQSSILPYSIVLHIALVISAIVYPYRRLRLPKNISS